MNKKQMLPEYLNCENKEFQYCDYFMHTACPETCVYAKDIKGNKTAGDRVEIENNGTVKVRGLVRKIKDNEK